MKETRTYEAYEMISRPDVGSLPEMWCDGVGYYWDERMNHPVDMDKLAEAGYLRRVRITETKEYLS